LDCGSHIIPALLRDALRVLKPGGVLYCTEVFNSGLYARPRQPALEDYGRAFNRLQEELDGGELTVVPPPDIHSPARLVPTWLQRATLSYVSLRSSPCTSTGAPPKRMRTQAPR
jgi:ubiquinone/menaquinone biosynthesis C-methylase UbiE